MAPERARVSDTIGPMPALVSFLNLREGQTVKFSEFTPGSGSPKADYTLTAHKLQGVPGTQDSAELAQMVVLGKELEESIIWANQARRILKETGEDVIDINGTDNQLTIDQVYAIRRGIRSAEDLVTDSLIDFLSQGRTRVTDFSWADPDFKVDYDGSVGSPRLVTIERTVGKGEEAQKQTLTIPSDRFDDARWHARDHKLQMRLKYGPNTSRLEENFQRVDDEIQGILLNERDF